MQWKKHYFGRVISHEWVNAAHRLLIGENVLKTTTGISDPQFSYYVHSHSLSFIASKVPSISQIIRPGNLYVSLFVMTYFLKALITLNY